MAKVSVAAVAAVFGGVVEEIGGAAAAGRWRISVSGGYHGTLV